MSVSYSKLTLSNMMFPLALVLFEFSVYICNDMVQPAMLKVTEEFMVDSSWVPASMTAFILGGVIFGWLTGPISDRIGRRPVLLSGIVYFIVVCLATYLVNSIESFIVLRVFQGIGLCFINAVGYATIQECFEEKAAVKATSLMANVALVSPLIGPLSGAYFITFLPWRADFLIIAVISFISLVGLIIFMPETVDKNRKPTPISKIASDYGTLLKSKEFVLSALCIPILAIPLLGWIALSPVLLVKDLHLSEFSYGMLQIPVFIGSIAGNIILSYMADRWPLSRMAYLSLVPCIIGVIVFFCGVNTVSLTAIWLTAGMTLHTFGEGLTYGVLYRFALTSNKTIGKGTVAACMSMISMLGYSVGIEVLKIAHTEKGLIAVAIFLILFVIIYIPLMLYSAKAANRRRLNIVEVNNPAH